MVTARIVLSVALLGGVLLGISWLGRRFAWGAEAQRKLIHTSIGLYALTFPIVFDRALHVAIVCSAAIVLLIVVRVLPRVNAAMGSGLHGVERRSFGDIFFAFSIAYVFVLSGDRTVLYILPILILTLSDASAALVGMRYGLARYNVVEGTKSLEGSTFFFLTAWLLSMVALLWLTEVDRRQVVLIALILAMFGTALEATSWEGVDNLFVPLGLFLLLSRMLDSSLGELAVNVAVFAVLMTVAAWILRAGRIGRHTVLTSALLLFFFWIVAGWATFPAPIAVVAACVTPRRADLQPVPELPLVLTITVVAVVWYGVAVLTGYDVHYVFNVTLGLLYLFIRAGDKRIVAGERQVVWRTVALAWLIACLHLPFIDGFGFWRGAVYAAWALGVLILGLTVARTVRRTRPFAALPWQAGAAGILATLAVPVTLWL